MVPVHEVSTDDASATDEDAKQMYGSTVHLNLWNGNTLYYVEVVLVPRTEKYRSATPNGVRSLQVLS